jgi:hypothetical protein
MRELGDQLTTTEYKDRFLISVNARCTKLRPPHVWVCDVVVLVNDPLEPGGEWEVLHRETLHDFTSPQIAAAAGHECATRWVDAASP